MWALWLWGRLPGDGIRHGLRSSSCTATLPPTPHYPHSPRPLAGALTGLFLALAAIQFVVADKMPSSSYTTALQQLVLASYCCIILVGIENLLIWRLTIMHKLREL